GRRERAQPGERRMTRTGAASVGESRRTPARTALPSANSTVRIGGTSRLSEPGVGRSPGNGAAWGEGLSCPVGEIGAPGTPGQERCGVSPRSWWGGLEAFHRGGQRVRKKGKGGATRRRGGGRDWGSAADVYRLSFDGACGPVNPGGIATFGWTFI